jgi:uncharacterized protein
MSDTLARLHGLQTLDTGLQQRRQWIAELDDGAKARRKLAEATASLEAQQAELHSLEATARRKELELQSADAERQQRSKRAYGGTVHDAKELSALEKKIAELKRRAGALEDELLALMDRIEAARRGVTEQEALVRKLTALARQLGQDYAETKAKFEGEISDLQRQRDELVPQLEPAALREYEALRTKLGGVAVATIEGTLCTSCRNFVPSAVIGQVRLGRELVKCENCRRILVLKP